MKKNIILLIVSSIFIFNCSLKENSCSNPIAEKKISKHIKVLEDNYKKDFVLSTNLLKSISFLSEVSKIESKVIYGDVTVYKSYSDFKADLSNWKKWFKKNKCKVDEQFIIDIEKKINSSYEWNNPIIPK